MGHTNWYIFGKTSAATHPQGCSGGSLRLAGFLSYVFRLVLTSETDGDHDENEVSFSETRARGGPFRISYSGLDSTGIGDGARHASAAGGLHRGRYAAVRSHHSRSWTHQGVLDRQP